MERYSDAVINENGRAIVGASVRILDANGLLASIYSDLAGTAMENPTATDTLGRWSFCAPAGTYSAEIILGNVVRYTLKDIALIDPSSDLSVLASNTGAGLIGTSSGQTVQQVTNTNASQIAANAAAITAQANALAASGGAALIGVSTGGNLQTKLNGLTTSVAGLSNYTLPIATSSVLGGVKQGAGVSIDGAGVLSVSYTAPIATATTVGVVKPGSGLVIDGAGVLTATGTTTGSVASVNTITPTGGNVTLTTDSIAESGSPTNKWFTPARVIASVLTGLSTATNAAVTAADTILAALGKLQAQVTSNASAITSNASAISMKQDASAKDASGGFAGLTGYAVNLKNAAGLILSQLVSSATAARTWTMPDKSGTVALTSDSSFLLLGAATVSTAVSSINFLSLFSSAYDKYVIELEAITTSPNDALVLGFSNGGVIDSSTSYTFIQPSGSTNSTPSQNYFVLASLLSNTASQSLNMTIEIRNANDTVRSKSLSVRGSYGANTLVGEARYTNAAAVSGITLYFSGGATFASGAVRIYGIKNS